MKDHKRLKPTSYRAPSSWNDETAAVAVTENMFQHIQLTAKRREWMVN